MLFCNYLFSLFLLLSNVNTVHSSKWLKTVSAGYTVSWKNCGPSSDPVQLKSLTITPDPIKVPGNFTIDGSADVTSQIPTDVYASVLLERKVGPFFVKVPCVDKFGSCNYSDVCDMWAKFCPKYVAQYGLPCQCPIQASTYSLTNAVISINKHVPSELLGEYRARVDFGSNEGHLACVDIDLTVKK